MVADVGYLCRMMTHSESTYPITRDLLGIVSDHDSSQELDLDLQVPSGYEKRLDLKSGKVYLERCRSSNAWEEKQKISKLQNLRQPQESGKSLSLFDDINLDLKLVSLSTSSSSYQSVCTLGKVKFALERAEKENTKKRCNSMSNSAKFDDDEANYAAGCPSCLLYVLISTKNPRCPRCKMMVPSPTTMKRPRIDLNIAI